MEKQRACDESANETWKSSFWCFQVFCLLIIFGPLDTFRHPRRLRFSTENEQDWFRLRPYCPSLRATDSLKVLSNRSLRQPSGRSWCLAALRFVSFPHMASTSTPPHRDGWLTSILKSSQLNLLFFSPHQVMREQSTPYWDKKADWLQPRCSCDSCRKSL